MFHVGVTVNLALWPSLRIILSEAYNLYYSARNPKFDVWLHLRMTECHESVLEHCDLDKLSRIIVLGAYLLYYLR